MLETVKELIVSSPRSSYKEGSETRFLRINDKWGFKIFRSQYDRDESYRFQKIGHSIGWGPEVGESFDFNLPDDTYYGYITEVAGDIIYDRLGCIWEGDINRVTKGTIDRIYKDFADVGVRADDLHGYNVAYIGEGEAERIVVIDFGHFKDEYSDDDD